MLLILITQGRHLGSRRNVFLPLNCCRMSWMHYKKDMLLFSKAPVSVHRDISDFIVIFFFWQGRGAGHFFMFVAQKLTHHKERQLLSKSHSGRGCISHYIRQGLQKMPMFKTTRIANIEFWALQERAPLQGTLEEISFGKLKFLNSGFP